jgi:acylphosphatase
VTGVGAGGAPGERARLTAWVSGRVQGVGFRWWVRVNATELGLVGAAENLTDGRVRIVVEGDRAGCAELLERLEAGLRPEGGAPFERRRVPGQVVQVTHRWDAARGGIAGFVEW